MISRLTLKVYSYLVDSFSKIELEEEKKKKKVSLEES